MLWLPLLYNFMLAFKVIKIEIIHIFTSFSESSHNTGIQAKVHHRDFSRTRKIPLKVRRISMKKVRSESWGPQDPGKIVQLNLLCPLAEFMILPKGNRSQLRNFQTSPNFKIVQLDVLQRLAKFMILPINSSICSLEATVLSYDSQNSVKFNLI